METQQEEKVYFTKHADNPLLCEIFVKLRNCLVEEAAKSQDLQAAEFPRKAFAECVAGIVSTHCHGEQARDQLLDTLAGIHIVVSGFLSGLELSNSLAKAEEPLNVLFFDEHLEIVETQREQITLSLGLVSENTLQFLELMHIGLGRKCQAIDAAALAGPKFVVAPAPIAPPQFRGEQIAIEIKKKLIACLEQAEPYKTAADFHAEQSTICMKLAQDLRDVPLN